MEVSGKWSDEASNFSKLQVYENIHEGFYFPVTFQYSPSRLFSVGTLFQ